MIKKLSIVFSLFAVSFAFSQTSLNKDFAEQISKVENAKHLEEFQQSKDFFAKTTGTLNADWRSYYFAALSLVRGELNSQKENKTQGISVITGSAEKYLSPILEKQKNNAEVLILLSQIHLLKSYSSDSAINIQKANEYLNKATALDKNNPRIDIIKGEITLNSPSKNGGDKTLAKKYFNSALAKFKNYSKKSNLDPSWGQEDANYYLSILN